MAISILRRTRVSGGAAVAHREANPVTKVLASRLGLTPRTAQRWKEADSPQEKYAAYLLASSDPYRLEANNRATEMLKDLGGWTDERLVERIRELASRGAIAEG